MTPQLPEDDPPDTDATWLWVAIALPFVAAAAMLIWHLVDPRPVKSEPWDPRPRASVHR